MLTPQEEEKAQWQYEVAMMLYEDQMEEWEWQVKGIYEVHATVIKTCGK